MLRDCPLLERVARAVVRAAAPLPVTAKIRIGWSEETINATTTARLLEDCGVQAIAVHGRTKEQGYSGAANWDVIEEVTAAVGIPVIGNGDIAGPEDGARAMKRGISGLMIGRAVEHEHPVDFPADRKAFPPDRATARRASCWRSSGPSILYGYVAGGKWRPKAASCTHYSRCEPGSCHIRAVCPRRGICACAFAQRGFAGGNGRHRRRKPDAGRRGGRAGIMAHIRLAETREDVARCFEVVHELRPHLEGEQFVEQVMRQQGRVAIAWRLLEDAGISCAGVRRLPHFGKSRVGAFSLRRRFGHRIVCSVPRGLGRSLFDWLVTPVPGVAGCAQFHLDSGVQRYAAHRFYLGKRMEITVAHHFRAQAGENVEADLPRSRFPVNMRIPDAALGRAAYAARSRKARESATYFSAQTLMPACSSRDNVRTTLAGDCRKAPANRAGSSLLSCNPGERRRQ